MTNNSETNLIPPHGGYRKLVSYQMAIIIYDLTPIFCEKFLTPVYSSSSSSLSSRSYIPFKSRTPDQIIQSARSTCSNIAEASQDSGTSKKIEIKLTGISRGCLEELLFDFESFLRQNGLPIWEKDDPRVLEIRNRSYKTDKTSKTYLDFFDTPERAANCLICLIHQTSYLVDRQLKTLEKDFLKNGGFTERLYNERKKVLEEERKKS